MELQQGFDLKLIAIPTDKLIEVAKTKTFFVTETIPKGMYGNGEDIPTAAILNTLVVRSDLSDDDVYTLTKALFENLNKLQNAHQAANGIQVENAQQNLIAPLHPGAQRYYDEVAANK